MTLRVLHAPAVVGGQPQELVRAERAIGLRSRAVSLEPSPYGYEIDEVLWRGDETLLGREAKRWRFLWRALREYDVVHFNFGRSILPCATMTGSLPRYIGGGLPALAAVAYARLVCQCDLPLLRLAGKAIFVTYQGDDARQGDYCREHFAVHYVREVGPEYYPPASDALKRRRIADFDRYAHGIYALNPDLLHILPRRAQFLPYSSIDPRAWSAATVAGAGARRTVAHAPTHRAVKGTRYLLEAVNRLKTEGFKIELRLIENLPHEGVRAALEGTDIFVDQLLAGWYGGAAVEAMSLGRPVVAYLRQEDLGFVPEAMRRELPVVSAEPGTVYEILKGLLLRDASDLAALGARGRRYIERWHDPRTVAQRLKTDYECALERR